MRFSGWPRGPIDYSNGDPPSVTPPLPPTADCYAGLASPLASVDPSPVIPGPRATPCPQTWTPSPVTLGPRAAPSPQTCDSWAQGHPIPLDLDPQPCDSGATPCPQTWTPSPVIPGPGATLCPRPGPQPCVSGPGDTPSPQTWLLSPPLPDPIPVSFSSTALPDTQPAYCAPICCLQPKCCLQGRWGICAFCPPRHALCIQRVSTDICEQRH